MLKMLILISCDACGQQFLYARTSSCNQYAWYTDSSALTAMACEYHWTIAERGKYHYCPDCSYDFDDMYEFCDSKNETDAA